MNALPLPLLVREGPGPTHPAVMVRIADTGTPADPRAVTRMATLAAEPKAAARAAATSPLRLAIELL